MSYIKRSLKYLFLVLVIFGGWYAGTLYALRLYPEFVFDNLMKNDMERGGQGSWFHLRRFPNYNWNTVVRPNQDTLYSSRFVDLSISPVLLTIPAADKYYSVAMYAENTDIVGIISSRTHGLGKAHKVLLVPPGYNKETGGYEVIESTTNKVWILARFYLLGKFEYLKTHALQDQIDLSKFTS